MRKKVERGEEKLRLVIFLKKARAFISKWVAEKKKKENWGGEWKKKGSQSKG
jgi:hypothetical protein